MKKLLIGLIAFALCAPQMHAMQMETAKTKSSTSTCGNAVKACCYLTAMCGLMMSIEPAGGQCTQNDAMDCQNLLKSENDDIFRWKNIEELDGKYTGRPGTDVELNSMMQEIKERQWQRETCRLVGDPSNSDRWQYVEREKRCDRLIKSEKDDYWTLLNKVYREEVIKFPMVEVERRANTEEAIKVIHREAQRVACRIWREERDKKHEDL